MLWQSRSGPVQEVESHSVESSPRATAESSKVPELWHNASGTLMSMLGAYVFGICIASLHLALYTYLDGKRVDADPTLQQSCASLVALILVNAFRLAMCFCLAIAFTQLMWRRVRLAPMSIADFDRLPQLLNDLRVLSHCSALKIVPTLSIIAALGWLITTVMIFPPGALTVVSKKFSPEIEKRVPTFNSSFIGNGTYAGGHEHLLGTQDLWMYISTKQSLVATAKGTLISRDVAASTSPCGHNCTFTTSFVGPLVKCHTTTFNETISVDLSKGNQHRPSIYSSGWTSSDGPGAREGIATNHGWRWTESEHPYSCTPFALTKYGPGKVCLGHSHPDTFFVSQHTAPHNLSLLTIRPNVTYKRNTRMKKCSLHRANYIFETQYSEGTRILKVSAIRDQSLESLWTADQHRFVPQKLGSLVPSRFMSTYQILNLFALFDSLVQALSGAYYTRDTIVIDATGHAYVKPADACDEDSAVNQTIIADSTFNRARYDFQPSYTAGPLAYPTLDLDLSEDRINEALQNITLSVMYTFKWWYTSVNVTTTTYQNTFSFSSRPRLLIPYVASLLLTLPFMVMGIRAMQLNGVPASDPGFIQTLASTAGSERLRDIAKRGIGELGQTKVRYGYVRDERGVKRRGFGVEGEVES